MNSLNTTEKAIEKLTQTQNIALNTLEKSVSKEMAEMKDQLGELKIEPLRAGIVLYR